MPKVREPLPADDRGDAPVRVLGVLAVRVGSTALGAAIGYLLLSYVLLPSIGLGNVDRVAQLGAHLQTPQDDAPRVVLLGNSITREGIDAGEVQSAAPPGWRVENHAVGGAGMLEQRLMLPKVLQTRPRVVVVSLDVFALALQNTLHPDKAYALAYASFVGAWPERWRQSGPPGVDEPLSDALLSPSFRQRLHFRTAPLVQLNETLRNAVVGNLRTEAIGDFTAPYQYLRPMGQRQLDRHLQTMRSDLHQVEPGALDAAETTLQAIIREIAAAGAVPLVVAAPVQPELRGDEAPILDRALAVARACIQPYGAIVVDAREILEAADFVDAVHANAGGRALYSRLVGRHVPPPTVDPP